MSDPLNEIIDEIALMAVVNAKEFPDAAAKLSGIAERLQAIYSLRRTPQPVTPAGGEVYVASSDVEAMVALKGRVADAGSQSRYAKSVGVSEAYVSDVLNGKRPIPEAWIPGFAKGWLRVNTHPPVADAASQPPIDNAFVSHGCEKFISLELQDVTDEMLDAAIEAYDGVYEAEHFTNGQVSDNRRDAMRYALDAALNQRGGG